MIIGVIFENGKEIDRGIVTGGKKYVIDSPEQYICIADETSAYTIKNERKYRHDETNTFQELQDNGNGWEVVYDSTIRIDKTKEYELPSWFSNPNLDIPDYHHRINHNGELITKSPFDTYSQSDDYYKSQLKESYYYFIQLIKISNDDNRKVIKEHLNIEL